jgi:protein ImuA
MSPAAAPPIAAPVGLPPAPRPALPPSLPSALWRGSDWRTPTVGAQPSGFVALDAELPGGGWPGQGLTELLQPQAGAWEWRLLWPLLGRLRSQGRQVLLLGPPHVPHGSGWLWVQARTAVERLWCAEQVLKANAAGAVLLWLPQARPEQLRRLQVAAQGHEGPVFVCRPWAARQEASAAPLRLVVSLGRVSAAAWPLQVQILKRRGPAHEGLIELNAPPVALAGVLPPRLKAVGGWSLANVPTREPPPRRQPAPPTAPVPMPVVKASGSGIPLQPGLFDDALGRLLTP